MKFNWFIALFTLMTFTAHAQVTPRPIFASSIYNGTGTIFVPTSTPFGNRACFFDNSSTMAASVTTATELTYLNGVTGPLQAQINALSTGAVVSVFGRTGVVVGASGDYSAFYPLRANNLSDLSNPATARTNLGLGTAATQAIAAFDPAGAAATAQAAAQAASDPLGTAATVQGLSLQKSANLSDLASATTARTNLGLGTAATHANAFFLQSANNLSDLSNAGTARTNLGLGSAATQPTTAFDAAGSATAVQSLSLQKSANLSDLASASTSRTNLGLGTAATQPIAAFDASGAAAAAQAAAIAASDPSGSAATVQGLSLQKSANLSDVANAATSRTNLGLGTAATQAIAAFDASGAAAAAQAASLQKSANLSDLASASTARTNLGLGTAATQASGAFDAAGAAAAAQAAAQAASDPAGTAATVQAASLQKTSNLADLTSPSNARTNLGLGSSATHPTTDFQAPLVFGSSLLNTSNTVTLVNDAPNPGATQVYGTDAFGLKGWYPASVVMPTNTITVTAKSANYTVLTSDSGAFDFNTAGGSLVATLPAASAFLVGNQSALLTFTKADASGNILTINPVGGDLIAGLASAILSGSWKSITIYSTGTGWAVR